MVVVIIQTGFVCGVFSATVVGHVTYDRCDSTDWFCLCCVFSDSLAFATEPVIGSLANVLGNFERLPANVHQEIKVGLNTEHSTVVYTVH